MSEAVRIFKNLAINAVNCLMITLVMGALNVIRGGSFPPLATNIVGYLFSFAVINLITTFIRGDLLGEALCRKVNAQPGSTAFNLLINAVINTVNTCFILPTMTWLNACFLGGAPTSAILPGVLQNFPYAWIATFIGPVLLGDKFGVWAEKFVNGK